MTLSYTGFAYLLIFVASGFLDYRFFQYWRIKRDKTSKLLFLFVLPIVLFSLITAVAGLFFTNNTLFLIIAIRIAIILQAIGFGALLYIIIYLKFPKISPWLGFSLIFILGILSAIFLPESHPVLKSNNSIDWGVNLSSISGILRIITLLPIIGFSLILIEQYKSEDSVVKARAVGLALIFLVGLIVGLSEFSGVGPLIRDIINIILGIFLTILIMVTQKAPSPEKI